jgi:hypothetical protein
MPKPIRRLWEGTHQRVLYRVNHCGEERTAQGIRHELLSERKVAGKWSVIGTDYALFKPTGSQLTVTIASPEGKIYTQPTQAHLEAIKELANERGLKIITQGRGTEGHVWFLK